MKVTTIPAENPETVRLRDGVKQNEPVRRRPRGFKRVASGVDASDEAELRARAGARAVHNLGL